MPYYHLRYTPESSNSHDAEMFVDWVRRLPCKDKLVVSEIGSENEHYHFHSIFWDPTSENNVRKIFVKKMQCKGAPKNDKNQPKTYMLKDSDTWIKQKRQSQPNLTAEEGFKNLEQYVCKGRSRDDTGPNVVLQAGKYDTAYIMQKFVDYWKYGGPKSVSANADEDRPLSGCTESSIQIIHHIQERAPRKKKTTFNEDVVNALKTELPGYQWDLRSMHIVVDKIIRMHGRTIKNFGPDQIEKEANAIMTHLAEDAMTHYMFEILKFRRQLPGLG